MADSWVQPLVFADGRCLPDRILPGPMDGITEGAFLQVLSMAGMVRCWYTPFLRISNGTPRRSRLRQMLEPFLRTGLPVVAQVMGTRAEHLAAAAARLHELGAVCVDLNCGCPSPTVIGSHSGGYALRNPAWIEDALCAMKEACGIHAVSVKLRMGFESEKEFPSIAEAVRRAAPAMVTCHFRTVREMYHPVPEGWRRLAVARELLAGIPLIGSGDLFTVQDALRMKSLGLDGVAPARGFVRNPMLLNEIRQAMSQAEKGEDARWRTPALAAIDRMALLQRIGEASGKGWKECGFLLRMARMMFGDNAPEVRELLDKIRIC